MKLAQFLANQEPLKLAIMDYEYANIDIITFSPKYAKEHWKVLSKKNEIMPVHEKEAEELFFERIWRYLFNRKISELLIIVYLLDLKEVHPNIYQLSRHLKRAKSQYSATHKEIKKLCELEILRTEEVGDSRDSMTVHIKKEVTWIYGDDEFRKAQIEDWEGARKYIEGKLSDLKQKKETLIDELDEQAEKMKKTRRG